MKYESFKNFSPQHISHACIPRFPLGCIPHSRMPPHIFVQTLQWRLVSGIYIGLLPRSQPSISSPPRQILAFYVRHEMGLERVHHGFQNSKRERIHLDFQDTSFATTWNPFPSLVYTTRFQTVFQYRTHWEINRIFFVLPHPQTSDTTRTCLSSSHTTSINSSRQSAPNLFR